LARRRQFSAGLGGVALLDNDNPDTNLCVVHGLLPIAPLVWREGAQLWTEGSLVGLLDELRSRDLWTQGKGPEHPDAIIDRIEAEEAAQAVAARKNMREDFKHRARDAWRSLKARTGQRNRRASDYHGAAVAQSGGRIITP
jgi:hypothetical protein